MVARSTSSSGSVTNCTSARRPTNDWRNELKTPNCDLRSSLVVTNGKSSARPRTDDCRAKRPSPSATLQACALKQNVCQRQLRSVRSDQTTIKRNFRPYKHEAPTIVADIISNLSRQKHAPIDQRSKHLRSFCRSIVMIELNPFN